MKYIYPLRPDRSGVCGKDLDREGAIEWLNAQGYAGVNMLGRMESQARQDGMRSETAQGLDGHSLTVYNNAYFAEETP